MSLIITSLSDLKYDFRMSEKELQNLTGTFNNIEQSEDIFDNFRAEDVVIVTWSPNSLTDWTVSPGAYEELIEDVLASKFKIQNYFQILTQTL